MVVSAKARLRALRDLELLRGPMGDPGLCKLVEAELAERRFLNGPGNADKCDYHITPKGRAYAAQVFS